MVDPSIFQQVRSSAKYYAADGMYIDCGRLMLLHVQAHLGASLTCMPPPYVCPNISGGASRSLVSPSGAVTARADLTVTEFLAPASATNANMTGNQTQSSRQHGNSTLASAFPGNTSSNSSQEAAAGSSSFPASASAVITRTRVLVTLYKLPSANVAGGADEGENEGTNPGALLSTAKDMAASLSKLTIDAIYPGRSYSSYISGWKGQLEENLRRRRRMALQTADVSNLSDDGPSRNTTSSLARRRRLLYWNKVNMFDQYRSTTVYGREYGVGVYVNRRHGVDRWNSREFEVRVAHSTTTLPSVPCIAAILFHARLPATHTCSKTVRPAADT